LKLTLGIDAGGTYTDAVLLDPASGRVWRKAKALTTPHDLSIGIARAIDGLGRLDSQQIELVSISTTLATNAIVEEHGGRVGLLLIGYDQAIMQTSGLKKRLPVEGMRYLAGGHDVKGDEVCPLDAKAARQAILEFRARVDAFAVSGYFGVMNPEHELRVRQMIVELTCAPVVCGHELTSKLNSLKRVSTAVLNARLLPIIQYLLDSEKKVLAERGIVAPLMVVKGDGSLMGERMARRRPVETILSGPAASAIGGQFLAGKDSAIVVDMGGTTTDIAVLKDGQPWTNPAGATVGGWQTSVQAADLRTIGIGGDSHIRVEHHALKVGPRRAIPLCRLGEGCPEIVQELEAAFYAGAGERGVQPTDFMTLARPAGTIPLSSAEEALLEALHDGPLSITRLQGVLNRYIIPSERLEALGVLRRAGLTPTDLVLAASDWAEVPGSLGMTGNTAAARAGAQVVARQLDLTPGELIGRALQQVVDRVAQEVLDKLVNDETGHSLFPASPGWAFVLEQILEREDRGGLSCRVGVRQPIVAIGAPVAGFIPQVAEKLGTRCIIPLHAEVGNAVGAIVASVTHAVEILVQPHVRGAGTLTFLVHTPHGREIFNHFPEAVARAEAVAVELARAAVDRAGAGAISVKVDRQEVVLGRLSEMTVRATATGRPWLEVADFSLRDEC
jgi:N-methylhydantoinase A/oxoprolinase/acetone carboxylase beta subunit